MEKNILNFLFELFKANSLLARKLSVNGLDFTDFIILHRLKQAPEKKLKRVELAGILGLTPSGITRMLLPLEKLGIITRDFSDADARARYASLTKAGENLLADAMGSLEIRFDDLFSGDETKTLSDFSQYLNLLCQKINS